MAEEYREPTWLVLKKAAQQLVRQGKLSFTRKELITYAKKHIDPERSESSLDFEVDLVTVNGNSKDRYRDPEKLFLFRIGRGRYTLYDPELHGPIEQYLEGSEKLPSRRQVIEQVMQALREKGYSVEEKRYQRHPLAPDIVAYEDGEKIGVWVVDPSGDKYTQLKRLSYSLGAALIERAKYRWIMIAAPPDIAARIPQAIRECLESSGVRIVYIKEERRYTVKI